MFIMSALSKMGT